VRRAAHAPPRRRAPRHRPRRRRRRAPCLRGRRRRAPTSGASAGGSRRGSWQRGPSGRGAQPVGEPRAARGGCRHLLDTAAPLRLRAPPRHARSRPCTAYRARRRRRAARGRAGRLWRCERDPRAPLGVLGTARCCSSPARRPWRRRRTGRRVERCAAAAHGRAHRAVRLGPQGLRRPRQARAAGPRRLACLHAGGGGRGGGGGGRRRPDPRPSGPRADGRQPQRRASARARQPLPRDRGGERRRPGARLGAAARVGWRGVARRAAVRGGALARHAG